MRIYICDTFSLTNKDYLEYEKIVSDETLRRTNKFPDESNRKSTVAGEAVARLALSEELGIPPEKIEIFRTEKGKPYVNENIYFSISHSMGTVAVIISRFEAGIDIEKIRPVNYGATRIFCTENEKEYIFSSKNEDEKLIRFYTVWTLKEAYLKCTGEGISGGLKSAEFTVTENGIICSDKKYSFTSEIRCNKFIISTCVKSF